MATIYNIKGLNVVIREMNVDETGSADIKDINISIESASVSEEKKVHVNLVADTIPGNASKEDSTEKSKMKLDEYLEKIKVDERPTDDEIKNCITAAELASMIDDNEENEVNPDGTVSLKIDLDPSAFELKEKKSAKRVKVKRIWDMRR